MARFRTSIVVVVGCVTLVATLLVALLVPFVVPVVFGLTGWMHRSEREFSGSVQLDQSPEQVYGLLTDYGRLPEWFRACTAVELLREGDSSTVWRTTFGSGEVASVNVMPFGSPPNLLWRFRSENRHVTAFWEFHLAPEAGGTHLTLKTSGVAWHWIYRITSDATIDDESHIRQFLDALVLESSRALSS